MARKNRKTGASPAGKPLTVEALPPSVDRAMKLAISVSATLHGVHKSCPRRACRHADRCRAAAAGEVCPPGMTDRVGAVAAAMVDFAWRLVEKRL